MNRALLSSESPEWGTPRDFFDARDAELSFTVDVCATPTNAKHRRFYSKRDNGLAQSWEGETAWCNPPYGRAIGDWVRKARAEAMYARCLTALLLPARVDTDWWRHFVMSADRKAGRLVRSGYHPETRVWWLRWEALVTGVYFHDARLEFEGAAEDGAPFPSVVVWHASPSRKPATKTGLVAGWPA